MQLGVIGLGRMGANIVRRLTRAGHACVVYDRDPAPGKALAAEGATRGRIDLRAMVGALAAPRTVWIMLPAGARDRIDDRIVAAAALARRLRHRRRQSVLARRRAARQVARRRGHRLYRRRRQRRRVGARARLLHDDRRPARDGRAARSDLQDARARPRRRFRRPRAAKGATRASRKAISTPVRAAPAISSRWCTTASNTA